MQIISKGLTVTIRDQNGIEMAKFNGLRDYEEICDEIKLRSKIFISDIVRGFVGNLSYKTIGSIDVLSSSGERAPGIMMEYRNVLLAKVEVYSVDDDGVIWQYTFLKE